MAPARSGWSGHGRRDRWLGSVAAVSVSTVASDQGDAVAGVTKQVSLSSDS